MKQLIYELATRSSAAASQDERYLPFRGNIANMRVIGLRRTIMIDVGLSSNFAHLEAALDHAGCRLRDIDMVVSAMSISTMSVLPGI